MANPNDRPVFRGDKTAPAPKASPLPKSGGSKSGAAAKPVDPVSSAERRAINRENKAKSDAATKYNASAKILRDKAAVIQKSLTTDGFRDALQQRLDNVMTSYLDADGQILSGYSQRVGSLKDAATDNEIAANDTSVTNLNNRARERTSALTEAMNMGAGESDTLKSTMMSLQSWDANQNDVNRSFFDSLRSINSSLTDLNTDTKTARLNAETQKNNDQAQLWAGYYEQKSQGYTDLSNLLGQEADLRGSAKESGSKAAGKAQKKAAAASLKAFQNAGKAATTVRETPGNSAALLNWQGEEEIRGRMNSSKFENAATAIGPKNKPSGASLREW